MTRSKTCLVLFGHHGFDPCDVTAHLFHQVRARQLAGTALHAQIELLLEQFVQGFAQLGLRFPTKF